MYEKHGTPPCGALNSYIWNKCIDEIADAIDNIALLRVEELHLLEGKSTEQPHCGKVSNEQLACAEYLSFKILKKSDRTAGRSKAYRLFSCYLTSCYAQ